MKRFSTVRLFLFISDQRTSMNFTFFNITGSTLGQDREKFTIINFVIAGFTVTCSLITIGFYRRNKNTLLILPSNKLQLSTLICQTFVGVSVTTNLLNHVVISFEQLSSTQALVYRLVTDVIKKIAIQVMVMHLCGQTFDRFISLFFSYNYKVYVSSKNVSRFISVAWLLPITVNFTQLIWLYGFIVHTQNQMRSIALYEIWWSVICLIIFILLPTVLNAIALLAMFIKIRYILQRTCTLRIYSRYQEFRTSVLFIFIYILFIILGMPYFSLRLIMDIKWLRDQNLPFALVVYHLTETFQHLSSLLYPLTYVSICPKFRKQVLKSFEPLKSKLETEHIVLLTIRREIKSNPLVIDTPV